MSEAYFLSGSSASNPGEAMQAAFTAARAREGWVDEVYLLSTKAGSLLGEMLAFQKAHPGVPFSAWTNQPGLDGLVLQTACRQLAAGERRLVLVVQQSRGHAVAVLLTGPQAVGAFNLAPLAQLLPAGTVPGTASAVPALDTNLVNWLGGDLVFASHKETFPTARSIPRTPAGLFFQLQAAARSLKKNSPLALLVNGLAPQALRFFLLERL